MNTKIQKSKYFTPKRQIFSKVNLIVLIFNTEKLEILLGYLKMWGENKFRNIVILSCFSEDEIKNIKKTWDTNLMVLSP